VGAAFLGYKSPNPPQVRVVPTPCAKGIPNASRCPHWCCIRTRCNNEDKWTTHDKGNTATVFTKRLKADQTLDYMQKEESSQHYDYASFQFQGRPQCGLFSISICGQPIHFYDCIASSSLWYIRYVSPRANWDQGRQKSPHQNHGLL
jgi:hypothetical protein